MIDIRNERPEDIPSIRAVNEQAFGQPMEAEIVDNLRASRPAASGRGLFPCGSRGKVK
jgi:predicted N-acetyltransferase YhbS